MDQAVNILGVKIQRCGREAALALVLESAAFKRPLSVAFANANLLNMSFRDPALQGALKRSLVLNDGVGVNLAARHLHNRPFPDNLNGTDFVPTLLGAAPAGLRVFLLGGKAVVNEEAVLEFKARWPQHQLVGSHHGYFAAEAQDDVVSAIKASEPQLVLVAMGNGIQERICEVLSEQTTAVSLAVGALFDFWTKRQPRAPMWMRQAGAEWVYRLWREPGRLGRRYLVGNPLFLTRVWRQSLRRRPAADHAAPTIASLREPT